MARTATQIDWRELFRQAVRDWNSKEKAVRLEEAQEAIQRRLEAHASLTASDGAERSEMESALYFLSLLSLAR
jgi:uncharacterized membrane protein